MLFLSEDQYNEIVTHARSSLPNEACGLMIGSIDEQLEPTGRISKLVPCRNADESRYTYSIDPAEQYAALRQAQQTGEEIVGVWHSHTHSDPYPSPTDVEKAADPHWIYVIVGLGDPEPIMRAFRIREGAVVEITEVDLMVFPR